MLENFIQECSEVVLMEVYIYCKSVKNFFCLSIQSIHFDENRINHQKSSVKILKKKIIISYTYL